MECFMRLVFRLSIDAAHALSVPRLACRARDSRPKLEARQLPSENTGGLKLRRVRLDAARMSACATLPAVTAFAQLPAGPGKAETEKLCIQCHELERSISLRQDREGCQATINKMSTLGMKGEDKEIRAKIEAKKDRL